MGLCNARSRFRGCLLGGAVGDALGAPVEFPSWAEIREEFGPQGIRDYVPAYGRCGAITDDTQMTLFTADGLLRARIEHLMRGASDPVLSVCHSYLDWLTTQDEGKSGRRAVRSPGLLMSAQALYAARAPGITCLKALRAMDAPTDQRAENSSKGCGGVMRVAPCGLAVAEADPEAAFDLACRSAALTHGHPTGYLSAGVFAVLVQGLVAGQSLSGTIGRARAMLVRKPAHEETLVALDAAVALAARRSSVMPGPDAVESLGGAWVAEEALAIAVYVALVSDGFEDGVVLAVNHGGDSDSTGAMAGNLLGAMHGVDAIPARWLGRLELRELIGQVADDLVDAPAWKPSMPDFADVRRRWPPE